MIQEFLITYKGNIKLIKEIAGFLEAELEDEVVIKGKSLSITETYMLDSVEDVENIAIKVAVSFPDLPFKLTAVGEEKDYLYNVQVTYDGNLVKASNSNYYRIITLADTINTYEEYQQSGISLKLTPKAFDEIKAGKSHIYNIRPDAKKPKLSVKIPMNDEHIIYPKKKVILEPIDRIGEIILISNQSQWGTTISAEMMVELDGEPIYFFERHYDTMKSLQFFVTTDSIRFFWEKDEKTDKEIKIYERIMAAAIEEYDSGFDFSTVCHYDGVFKLQLAALHKAIEEKAAELGIAVTSSWEM